MATVNGQHKQAAKAALARLMVHNGCTPRSAAHVVQVAQERFALQLGDLSRLSSKISYAQGVERCKEQVSNRKWGEFPYTVRTLAERIVALRDEANDWLQ